MPTNPSGVNPGNIISTTASKFLWVVGAYNFNESYFQPERIGLTGLASLTTATRYSFDNKYGRDEERLILYGPPFGLPNLGFQLPFSALAGPEQGAKATTLDPATEIYTRKLGPSWRGVTAIAGLQWKPDADTNVCGKHSRCAKSGGFNSGSGLSLHVEQQLEKSNDFPLGC